MISKQLPVVHFIKEDNMARYVDTALKNFPFAQITRPEDFKEDILPRQRHAFAFDYIEDNDGFPWEESQVDRILFEELGSTLDDLH